MGDATTAIPRVLVIGYGNPLRGDDAIGWVAARALGGKFSGESRVQVMAVQQLTPELADPLSKVELVILIDAAHGQRAGHLSCTFITPDAGQAGSTGHAMDPARLLGMARSLFGRAPQAMLFTVAGEDFSHREGLTRTVERACDRLVDHVYRIVLDELDHSPSAK
jgi:hydrogenase maturation protease